MLICRRLFTAGRRSLSRRRTIPITHLRLYSASVNPPNASASTSSSIDDDIKRLVSTTDIHDICTHYANLVAKLKQAGKLGSLPTRQILNETQLYRILWLLARSGRPPDVQMLYDILLDMPLVLGLTLTEDTHTAILRGLIYRGEIEVTRRWLERMPKLPGHITPTLKHYHMFLKALPDMDVCTLRLMRSIVKNMRPVGCKPTYETYEIIWLNRWALYDRGDKVIRPHAAAVLFDDMERDGLSYNPSFAEVLFQEYNKRGLPLYAEDARNMYEAKFLAYDTSASSAYGQMDIKLMRTAQSKGIRSAILLFKSWKPHRKPSPEQIRTLLRHSRQLADLRLVEQEFDVKCNVIHWSHLIVNNTRAGQLREALSIYDESKLAGIIPDTYMTSPLIHSLCQSSFAPAQEASVNKALEIYRDLCSAIPSEENDTDHSAGPEQEIYSTLLRGLATVKYPYKYIDVAKEIMNDMAARGITQDDSNTASSIIALHMRNASNTEEALDVYRRLKSPLDAKGYTVVLNVFCKLRFETTIQIPSLKGYFEIVKDMRLAGFNTTVEVYTILLHRLSSTATEVQQNDKFPDAPSVIEALTRTLRRVHDLLSLDASLSPDAVLWNQMISTYQRLGCFADAYRIWEMMYISGQFNDSSVSVILDACAFSGAYSIAKRIIERLMRDNYRFNTHNWSTWLECLCRLGKLDEAIQVLCGEIEGSPQGVTLNAEHVKLVYKFAKSENREGEVLHQIREKSPNLWATLPAHIQGLI